MYSILHASEPFPWRSHTVAQITVDSTLYGMSCAQANAPKQNQTSSRLVPAVGGGEGEALLFSLSRFTGGRATHSTLDTINTSVVAELEQ